MPLNKIWFCPECINEWLKKNPVHHLGDEIYDLHGKPRAIMYGPNGCPHKNTNTLDQLTKARAKTLSEYERRMKEGE